MADDLQRFNDPFELVDINREEAPDRLGAYGTGQPKFGVRFKGHGQMANTLSYFTAGSGWVDDCVIESHQVMKFRAL